MDLKKINKKAQSSSKLCITETTESRAVLNICEYVFSVFSIFVCPKYLATNVTLAPEQKDRNYGKSIRWIEREIIPGFLLEEMQKYINKSSNKIKGNDKKYLE